MSYNPAQRTVNFLTSLFRDDEPEKAPARSKTRGKPAPKVTTRRQEVQAEARRQIKRQRLIPRNPITDFTESFASSVGNTLGIAPRVAAGILSVTQGRPYNEVFREVQAQESAVRDRSLTGNIIGALYGGGGTGAIASGALRAGGARVGGRVGQAAQSFTRLERGQRLRNVGKLAAGGAIGGGAQAAGEGSDVSQGVAVGAIAAPVLVGLGKGAMRVLALPASAIGGSSAVKGVLRRMTNTTTEDLAARAAARRAETGTEPTVFELLDPADQKRILEDVVGPNADVGEDAARTIAARLQETGGAMQGRVGAITAPRVQAAEEEIAGRLASARGTAGEGDQAFAAQAARSPEAMERLRSEEAAAIMAPFDNQIAVGSVDDLVPTVPVNRDRTIVEAPDPEIAAVIRSVSGTARLRGEGGITVNEITKMRRKLRALANKNDINSGPAAAALQNIDEVVAARMPEAAAAIARMDEAFAGASRMAEGMQVGARTTVRDVPGSVGTSDRESQLIRNVFDTPEGATGRALGQTNRLLEMFAGGASESARALREIRSNSTIQRAISENIGAQESGDIVKAATALDDGVRALARALPRAEGAGQGADDLDVLVDAFTIGNPASFPTAKMWALRRLVNATPMPERTARNLVEMLFSRDPNMTRRALNLLNSSIEDAASFRRDLGLAMVLGQVSASSNAASVSEPAAQAATPEGEPDYSQMSDEELLQMYEQQSGEPDYSQMSDEELLALAEEQSAAPFGVSAVQSVFPEAEITDDIRDPNSPLGQANPNSFHVQTDGAVDVRPIPGVTFDQFVNQLQAAGYNVIEAIDEVNNPSGHATGPHWHVVLE